MIRDDGEAEEDVFEHQRIGHSEKFLSVVWRHRSVNSPGA